MSQPPPSPDPYEQVAAQLGQPAQPPPPNPPYTGYGSQAGYAPPGQPPYPQQPGYPPQPGYPSPGYPQPMLSQQPYGPVRNPRANSALFYGIVSVVLGGVTLATRIGFAGIITGGFAIFYGITSLIFANRFPHKPGRAQSIAAIVLGSLALLFVLVGFLLQLAVTSSY